MRRLLTLSIIMCLTLIGVLFAVRVASANMPMTIGKVLVESCAPPCWNDITPGVTTVDEAVPLLHANPILDRISEWVPGDFVEQERKVCWGFKVTRNLNACVKRESDTEGPINIINFNALGSTLRIGDMMGIYGQPLAVRYIFTGSGLFASVFFNNNVEVIVHKSFRLCQSVWISPDTPVSSIMYHYAADEPPFEFDTPAWQGFKAIPEITCG
jgi:hypothetical protein